MGSPGLHFRRFAGRLGGYVSLTPVPLLLEWGIHTLTLQIVDGPASQLTDPCPCLIGKWTARNPAKLTNYNQPDPASNTFDSKAFDWKIVECRASSPENNAAWTLSLATVCGKHLATYCVRHPPTNMTGLLQAVGNNFTMQATTSLTKNWSIDMPCSQMQECQDKEPT